MTKGPEVSRELDQVVKYNPDVISGLERMGQGIEDDAELAAPKRTGAGAKSITHEVGHDLLGPYVRVSWDKRHFYLMFAELGTEHENARPFLRPAAEKPRKI